MQQASPAGGGLDFFGFGGFSQPQPQFQAQQQRPRQGQPAYPQQPREQQVRAPGLFGQSFGGGFFSR